MRIIEDTVFKLRPVQAANLPDGEKREVAKGSSFEGVKVLDQRAGHVQIELPDGGGTWWVFGPHTEGLNLGVQLKVPYQSQRDNYRDASRTCFSSSCAMALMFLRPGVIGSDDDYIEQVFRFGDSTDASAQIRALEYFGLKAEFRENGSVEGLQELLQSGVPVPCGILHHGSPSAPSGGGHWICVIGYGDDALAPGGGRFIVHDPWGEIDHTSGTYPSSNGEARRYSYGLMRSRWTVEGPGSGWYMRIRR